MHSDIPYLHLHVERHDVETADFRASAGDAFQLGNHAAPHIGLKGFCGGVPEAGQSGDDADTGSEEKIFPPAPAPGGRLTHRVSTPSPGDLSKPGTLTRLSARSDCSQETISSLTFSSVSNSRILAETSASATSAAPDCFNRGTNVSR